MLKIWRSDYFESEIKPLINGNDIVIHKIDFKDEFTMQTIRARTEEGYYKEFKTVIEDLSKVIRFIDNGTLMYIQKAKNVYTNTYHVQFVSDKDMSKSLKMMKLWRGENGQIETVYTALVRYASKL